MPEIIPITSEALQSQIRGLLPSQRGFGEDLHASNVITPIIDLTAAAEGSVLRQDLQRAVDFAVDYDLVSNTTSTIINTTGFWRVYGSIDIAGTGATLVGSLQITTGLATNTVFRTENAVNQAFVNIPFDFTVFLRAGDSLTATSSAQFVDISIFNRQIADVNGNLTSPLGYSSE